MDLISQTLLVGGLLLFTALLLSAVSQRAGVPALLVFLAVGLLATELPGATSNPFDAHTAVLIGNLALAVILLDGGLRTRVATFRLVAAPALTLATAGVLVTAVLVGAFAVWLFEFDWRYGLLLGAIVGSTDAAAVFALLRSSGKRLSERVEATVEVESGANDPMAVFLTLACIELIRNQEAQWPELLKMFVLQLGLGLAAGLLFGRLLAAIVARVPLGPALLALLIQSGGLVVFSLTTLAQGSGFLAIYLAGILIARDRVRINEDVLRAGDGLAWLAQAGMFLILGLFTNVVDLLSAGPYALLVALALMVVIRPLSVALCLAPFHYPAREVAFIGWMGLRGAVPIVLGLFPLLEGLPGAPLLFHIAFFSVLLSLTLQGGTLQRSARFARVTVSEVSPVMATAMVDASRGARTLVELQVFERAPVANRPLAEVQWPDKVSVAEIFRGSSAVAASELTAGDVVVLLAPIGTIAELEHLFSPAGGAGEWNLRATATLADLRDYYGFEIPADAQPTQSLADFLRRRLHGRPVVGDCIRHGALELTVRSGQDGQIERVGLRLLSSAEMSKR